VRSPISIAKLDPVTSDFQPAIKTPLWNYPAVILCQTIQLPGEWNWFIIIGGLSVVNSLISLSGGRIRFIFGLGATEFVDALAQRGGSISPTLLLGLSVLFGGFVALFGFFGRKEQSWAFIVGMGIYLCDGLLLLPVGQYLGAAFHVWALFRIFQGLQGLNTLNALRERQSASMVATSGSWNQ
jgi:hypothetical protein